MDWCKVIEKAFEGMERAYAPYSGFRVGAALLGKSGAGGKMKGWYKTQ